MAQGATSSQGDCSPERLTGGVWTLMKAFRVTRLKRHEHTILNSKALCDTVFRKLRSYMRLALVLQADGDGRLPAVERRGGELLPLGQWQMLLRMAGETTFDPLEQRRCPICNVASECVLLELGPWGGGPGCRPASSARCLRGRPCAPAAARVVGWTEQQGMTKHDTSDMVNM